MGVSFPKNPRNCGEGQFRQRGSKILLHVEVCGRINKKKKNEKKRKKGKKRKQRNKKKKERGKIVEKEGKRKLASSS